MQTRGRPHDARRRSILALGTIAMATLSACQPPERQSPGATAVDTAAIIAIIDSMGALYEQTVATGDFETMGNLLADGAVMVGPGGPQWDALRAESEFPWPPGVALEMTPIETVVLNEEWAYVFGTSTATYTPEGTTEPQTLRDTHLVLLRKTEAGWKLYREVASPALPPEGLLRQ